jgi:hypothetical protein
MTTRLTTMRVCCQMRKAQSPVRMGLLRTPHVEWMTLGDTTKRRKLIPPGCILCKHIKYDMSDFLGSCVRLFQDLTNTGNVPLKPAIAFFIDETVDDYGLGAGRPRTDPRSTPTWIWGELFRSLLKTPVLALSVADTTPTDTTMTMSRIVVRRYMETSIGDAYHIVRIERRVRFLWR